MKHVFIIGNFLTFRISISIIKRESLLNDEVVFLYRNRSIRFPKLPFSAYYCPECIFSHHPSTLNPLSIIQLRACFFAWMPSELQSDFHLYTPNSCNRLARLLVGIKTNRGYSYFEEGMHSYDKLKFNKSIDSPLRRFLFKIFQPFSRFGVNCEFKDGYKNVYVTSEYALQFETKKRKYIEIEFPYLPPGNQFLAYQAQIFILQTMKWHQSKLEECYKQSIKYLLEDLLKKNKKPIFYKLHPEQVSDVEGDWYRDLFDKSGARLIDASIIPESLLNSVRSADVFILSSSIPLYVKNKFVRYHLIINTMHMFCEEQARRYLATIPAYYLERVKSACVDRELDQ